MGKIIGLFSKSQSQVPKEPFRVSDWLVVNFNKWPSPINRSIDQLFVTDSIGCRLGSGGLKVTTSSGREKGAELRHYWLVVKVLISGAQRAAMSKWRVGGRLSHLVVR